MFILDDGDEYRNYHETGKNQTFCTSFVLYNNKIIFYCHITDTKYLEIDKTFIGKYCNVMIAKVRFCLQADNKIICKIIVNLHNF